MATASQTYEGTTGAWPSAMTGSYGSFTWTSTPAGSATDVEISTTVAKVGSKSARYNPSCTQGESYLIGVGTPVYFRVYGYLTAAPAATFALATLTGSGFAVTHNIGITSDRRVFISVNQSGSVTSTAVGTVTSGTANSVPLNQWFRIEGKLANGSSAWRLYASADAGIGSETESSGDRDGSSLGTPDMLEVGVRTYNGSAPYTFLSASQYLYLDDFQVSDVGWIGPSASAAGTSYSGIVRI